MIRIPAVILISALAGAPRETPAQSFVRQPFLQMGTPHSVSVCWRLGASARVTVKYGKTQGAPDTSVTQASPAADGCVDIAGLTPATRYFYELHNGPTKLAGGAGHYFVTHPPAGSKGKAAYWLLGDPGTGSSDQEKVREGYIKANGGPHADAFILLGDNAYEDGNDREYTDKFFKYYPTIMSNTVTWSTIGNHENQSEGVAYLAAFRFPTEGQAGGVASKSELYYSWDHGNVHFICLDSERSGRGKSDPMYKWLEQDLQATRQDWIIAYWHSPPYSWGTHNSDSEEELVDMRTTFVPLLEQYGVDLVYCGHSHNYERSFLLDGAYGNSGDNKAKAATVVLDKRSGDPAKEGPYRKASLAKPHEGTVYTVSGSGGDVGTVKGLHPMMLLNLTQLGSVILTIEDNVATSKFIDANGALKDQFQVVQAKPVTAAQAGKTGARERPSFSRLGRHFRFADDNAHALRIYDLEGGLRFHSIPRGAFELDALAAPPGEYYFRYGSTLGRMTLP